MEWRETLLYTVMYITSYITFSCGIFVAFLSLNFGERVSIQNQITFFSQIILLTLSHARVNEKSTINMWFCSCWRRLEREVKSTIFGFLFSHRSIYLYCISILDPKHLSLLFPWETVTNLEKVTYSSMRIP